MKVKILFVIHTTEPTDVRQQAAIFSLNQEVKRIKTPNVTTERLGENVFLIDGNSDCEFLSSLIRVCSDHQKSYQLSFLSEPIEWIQSKT